MAKGELRSGYTTGACAAAGVKAAFLYMAGADWHEVSLTALDGTPLTIPVKDVVKTVEGIRAEVVKFSGDDPDITNGVSVFTTLTLLDEVTSGLDFETRQKLMKKLVEWYKERNTTLLVTSHYYEELEHLVNKILYLDNGKVIDFGNKDELFTRYCGKAVILCEENNQTKEIAKSHKQIIAPDGMIALRCDEPQDEIAISEALSNINVNYRRSNNDIELMTINAKAVYYKGGKQ